MALSVSPSEDIDYDIFNVCKNQTVGPADQGSTV